ncbi:CAMK family protein kinase [Trichomonas vaginalis G3]|uniref:CAMK family protein kinase n=1 Tax=Trichomonas vaginalis (strain ATCC PRA-98 / G3) TaxID=412133 RepID=A2FV13_TRIV3|nr:protein serine/threonine kinase protein [Trichomonas vaginalis G3]EAX91243.1 CAMK family protein kinase [Trichomonas vaginalis G3]KAI5509092.1 protein serine/threonine kinase protein [Trichomonas vaginalis G3]|eukprot:XP_001304173.1 CAMK family protein kinase [Trichomonas vaginalis G3]
MESDLYCSIEKYHMIHIPQQIGKYRVIKVIGKGAFAAVVLALNISTEEYVAIKIIDRDSIIKQGYLLYLENELRLSSRFDHPNIAKVHEVIYTSENIMIVMEYLPNGDLSNLLTRGIIFGTNEQFKFASQIVSALEYLHDRGISHRDIKPENMLFDDEFNVKLVDFGLSKENCSSLQTYCGTPVYMAPEIACGKEYDGAKADIWAFGITFHAFCFGMLPYPENDDRSMLSDIKKGNVNIHPNATGTIKQILDLTLNPDSAKRATAKELLDIIHSSEFKNHLEETITFPKKISTAPSLPHLSYQNTGQLVARSRRKNGRVISKIVLQVRKRTIKSI